MHKFVYWITSLCLFSLKFDFCTTQEVTVTVSQGQLRGSTRQTAFGITFYSFLGIPYAKPPVGSLRFKAPEPVDSWEGIRDALETGPQCPQPSSSWNEDCLYLNVITPKIPSSSDDTLLPTMVYIHGGAFLAGNGNDVPTESDLYLGEDIVLASMNYRLGPLGFLSTGDSVVPGNNGLKDQVMALQWVQQNIAQFGGDPNRVTIFGMSAGGASVHYQVLSPMSKGLFQGAIAQSGSALNPWAFEDISPARARTLRYVEALGINSTNSSEIAEALRTLTAQEILDGVGKAQTELEENHGISFFMPTVEEASESEEEIFLQEHPLRIMEQGTFNHVPFMTGTVSQEGMIRLTEVNRNPSRLQEYNENFEIILPEDLEIVNSSQSEEIASKVKAFYFGSKALSQETMVPYINFLGDTQFLYGVNLHARMHGIASTEPVFQYYFTNYGRLGSWKRSYGDIYPGNSHSEEEGFLFYYPPDFDVSYGPENDVSKRMITLWTNFAKTGNPTPDPDPLLGNVTWSPVTELDHFYLDIGNDLILRRDLQNDRMAFWFDMHVTLNA